MIAKYTTREALNQALAVVNAEYSGNVKFKGCEPMNQAGSRWRFTLTVENSREPGSRYAPRTGRRIAAACWHVHGLFFDALMKASPESVVSTQGSAKITATGGNWQDWEIGRGFYASQSCDCGCRFDGRRLIDSEGQPVPVELQTVEA